jgi:hypothetical protein
MSTESNQSGGNRYQGSPSAEEPHPAAVLSADEPAALMLPWSVPQGLIIPDPRSPQPDTPEEPIEVDQKVDPGDQRLAGEEPADDDAWPGVAPPAGWFLRASQPPEPDHDALASQEQPQDAAAAAFRSWPGVGLQGMPSPHREPDGSWSSPLVPAPGTPSTTNEPPAIALGPTRSAGGRAGGPGLPPSRAGERTGRPAAALSPWQKSQHRWDEAGIVWEQEPQVQRASGRHARPDAPPPGPANSIWPGHMEMPLGAPVFSAPIADDDGAAQDTWIGNDTRTGEDTWTAQDSWTAEDHWAGQESWEEPLDRWADERRPVRGRRSLPPAPEASRPSPHDSLLFEPSRRGPRRPGGRGGRISHRAATIGVPVVVLVAVAALAGALLTGHAPKLGALAASQGQSQGKPAGQNAGTPQLPLTAVALPTYAGQQQRGVFQTISRVVASGNTIVAMGTQVSGGVVRQQFFTSSDAGASWQLAPVQALAGGKGVQPPLGHSATLLAGGPGGWVAVGSQAIWTSQNGLSWALAATHGISPQLPGDSVWVITRTASGFLAAGTAPAGRGATQAVIWTSADGVTWHRMTASQLGLSAAGETVRNISYATWRGNDTVISGTVAAGAMAYDAAWLSTDGGSAWTRVAVPIDHGAGAQISGLAFDGSGLIAVRPGRSASGTEDGIAYFSPNGQTWQYAATIDPAGGWTPSVVKGTDDGFVVTGQSAGGQIVAYTSTGTATAWLPTTSLGSAAAVSVTGATVLPGDAIIAVGGAAASRISQQPLFLEANAAGSLRTVSLAGIAGGIVPEVTVNSTAVADGQQIAVGSADGYPAVWRKASGGSWTLVSSLSLAQSRSGAGLTALTSVTHGAAGWLAVGAPGPVIWTSANGATWQTAAGGITQGLAGVGAVAAASGPAGYAIVGKLVAPGGACVADVWWSPNLTRWTRAHDANDATGSSQVLAVAASMGGFVSVGSHESKPAVWTTADGRTWETIVLPTPDGASAATLEQVAVAGNRVVALGQLTTAAGPVPFAELSVDGGGHWQQVPFSSPGPDTAFTALTADSAGFTAAGLFGLPGQQNVAVWTSATGASWTPTQASDFSGAGAWQISALAPSGSAVAGIGSIATQRSQQIVTLTLPPR